MESCSTGEKTKSVKDTKKLLDHFRRSTYYQKRNGTHNSHSVTYKINKKAADEVPMIEGDPIDFLSMVLNKKKPTLSELEDANADLTSVTGGQALSPEDLNKAYANQYFYNPEKSQLRNTAENAAMAAPAMYALPKAVNGIKGGFLASRRGWTASRAAKHGVPISAWKALRSGAGRVAGGNMLTVKSLAPNRLLTAAKSHSGKFMKFLPSLFNKGGAGVASRLATSGVAKAVPYVGAGVQALEWLGSGLNPYEFGRRKNELAALSELNDQSPLNWWRGTKDVASAAVNVPTNLFGTVAEGLNVISGNAKANRANILSSYQGASDRNRQLVAKYQQIKEQLKSKGIK